MAIPRSPRFGVPSPPGSGRNFRQPKSALRESLGVEHEAVLVPEEDLHPVASPSEKHEDVALIRVQVPRVSDKRDQPIMTTSKVNRLGGQVDPNTRRKA